jgi:hypothetical protein
MFDLLEFVGFEYCSTDVLNDFFELLLENSYEISASMGGSLRARLVLPNINKGPAKQFPPSVKKGRYVFDVPDGIIARLTRECGGNVHCRRVVEITCGPFGKVTEGDHGRSGAKDAVDVETGSLFASAYRLKEEDIPHTRNNWLCYDFKERRIVPTHYTIRTQNYGPGGSHLKS